MIDRWIDSTASPIPVCIPYKAWKRTATLQLAKQDHLDSLTFLLNECYQKKKEILLMK